MINNILNICIYDFKRLLNKKSIYFYILLISIILVNTSQSYISMGEKINKGHQANMWDGFIATILDGTMIMWFLFPMCLYFITLIFFDSDLNTFIKIRVKNKRIWILSKIITVYVFSWFSIFIVSIISLVINLLYQGFSVNWSDAALFHATRSSEYYTFIQTYWPLETFLINCFTFASTMTILTVIANLISLYKNNPKIGICISIMFMLLGKGFIFINVHFLKYFTLNNYLIFAKKNFPTYDLNGTLLRPNPFLLTINEVNLILALLIIFIIIISLIFIKKIDFSIGRDTL